MIYGIAALTCLLAAACAKVETAEPAQEEETLTENVVVFKATASEDDTKAEITLADGDFSWTATSDKIAVATNEGYKISTGATGVSGNKADFSVDLEGATLNTNAFALYPHTLVWNESASAAREDCNTSHDGDGDNLVVYLTDSYTIGDVTSPMVPCPMIASIVEDGGALGELHFKQLCAVLCIQVNSIPASANTLVLDFNGKKVSGKFEIATTVTPGASSIVAANDDAYDTITITDLAFADWKDNLVINIPVPTGVVSTNEFTNLTVTAKNGATTVLEMTRPIKVGANWVPQRAMRRKIVASLPAFSVADNVRVHIAKSNLQLRRPSTAKSWEATQAAGELIWEFMPEPWSRPSYTYVSKTYDSVSEDYADETVIAHFKFGVTGYNYNEGIEQEEDYIYGKYYEPWSTVAGGHRDYGPKGALSLTEEDGFQYGDWGIKACVIDHATLNDGYGVSTAWRVPSGDEYLFLFGRTQEEGQASVDVDEESDPRYIKRHHMWGMALVETADDVFERCMIVLPDHFVDPVGGFVGGNLDASEASCPNELSKEEWSLMEAAGAALYPMCGYRNQTTSIYKNAFNYCSNGGGWEDETSGSPLRIYYGTTPANFNIYVDSSFSRNGGNCVRLIRELN